jgi:hypothetical protein
MSEAEEAFDLDVSVSDQDTILTAIVEAAWGAPNPIVTIINSENAGGPQDPVIRASGNVFFNQRSFYFEIEDGNWNGTVLLHWEAD